MDLAAQTAVQSGKRRDVSRNDAFVSGDGLRRAPRRSIVVPRRKILDIVIKRIRQIDISILEHLCRSHRFGIGKIGIICIAVQIQAIWDPQTVALGDVIVKIGVFAQIAPSQTDDRPIDTRSLDRFPVDLPIVLRYVDDLLRSSAVDQISIAVIERADAVLLFPVRIPGCHQRGLLFHGGAHRHIFHELRYLRIDRHIILRSNDLHIGHAFAGLSIAFLLCFRL